ncbi:MAG: zinc-dependent metalloprotease, partial [Actinomycetota bacterium]|nr:zinc-dependent metalloprotease [Actinomycetota bacterium]
MAYQDRKDVERPSTLAGLLFEAADSIAKKISDFMPLGRGIRDAFSSKEEGLVLWNEVRKIALGVLNLQQEKPGVIQDEVVKQYQECLSDSKVAVEKYTGLTAEGSPDKVMVFDQADWIDANIDTFRFIFDEISSKYVEFLAEAQGKKEDGTPKGAHRMARTILTIQVGTMMGYLSRNVLGQYDLSLPGPQTEGKLYVVEPNVERITRELGLIPQEFRHWIVLHEATHSFEFQSSKWLRDYLSSSMKKYLDEIDWAILSHPNLKERAKKVGLRNTDEAIGGSLISLVLSEKQSQILGRLQAV